MTVQQEVASVDEAKVEAFLEKAFGDFCGAMTTALCCLGDRLGLFKALAEGPARSEELAQRTGIEPRYALEWLRGMAAAGYVQHDRDSGTFTLPLEHQPVVAQEGGPMFLGGAYQESMAMLTVFDAVAERAKAGGGVDQAQYPGDFWDGLARFTNGWFENHLIQEWIPAMPDVQSKLEAGARCADVGCGAGRASVKLAGTYARSRHVGFDVSDPQIERARTNAEQAGVHDRVGFEKRDVAAQGLPEKYDVITTFDVVHDAVDPLGLLKAIRAGLKDDGIYVCLDINCADDPADNQGPLAAAFYGFSVFYCMTTSLAHDGAGLGTCGLPEAKLRELATEAGFSGVRRLPLENPFNNVYELRA